MKNLRNIIEARRSPERAKKLADYLLKRQGGSDQIKVPVGHAKTHSDKWWEHNTYTQSDEDVPLKDVLHNHHVWKDAVKKKIDNPKGPPAIGGGEIPPLFTYQRGKYYVDDGNHRVFAARLLGKETIRGQVSRPVEKKK